LGCERYKILKLLKLHKAIGYFVVKSVFKVCNKLV